MNQLDRSYKQLIKDSREYLSDGIKRFNKARTDRERLYKIELVYRHYCKTAARLCTLMTDAENGKEE